MTSKTELDRMERDWKSLKKLSKDSLRNVWHGQRRVADSKGLSKSDLVNDILRA